MGSLFSNLSRSGVQQPSGSTSYFDSPEAATTAASKQLPSADSMIGGDVLSPTTNTPALPKVTQPTFAESTTNGGPFNPGLTTKGKILSGILLAAQGAAAGASAAVPTNPHISPGLGPAAAAGFNVPFVNKQKENELQNEQLEQQKQQAQTKLIAAQSEMVPTPYGQMPEGMAKLMFPAMIKAASGEKIADKNAASREAVADTNAGSRENVAGVNKRFMAVPGVGLMDTQDKSGKPTLVPGSEQGITLTQQHLDDYGLPKEFLGKTMTIAQLAQLERAQAMRAGTTTNTVEYKDDGQGNIVALPKTTTTKKNLPGSAPTATGGGSSSSGGTVLPKVVISGKSVPMSFGTDADNNQIAGTPAELKAAGVTNYSPLGTAEAAKVNIARQMTSPQGLFALAEKDLAKFKPGELEALSPRWNEFLAGKVGTDDPRYVALRTHVNGLLSTALMQAHMGARGGENIMEHFQDMANAGKMSKETLKAALDAEKEYVEEKAMRPKAKAAGTTPNSVTSKSATTTDPFAQFPGAKARQ